MKIGQITKKQALDLLQELKDRVGNHPYAPLPTAPIDGLIATVGKVPVGKKVMLGGLMMQIYKAGKKA